MERQIDQIREAEKAMRELLDIAAQIRREIEAAAGENRERLEELILAAERFEQEAQKIKEALEQWRKAIN